MVPRHRPGTGGGWGRHLQTQCSNLYRQDEDVRPGVEHSSSFYHPPSLLSSPRSSLSLPFFSFPVTQYPCFSIFNSLRGVATVPCIHPLNWKLPWAHSVTGSCSHQPDLILELFHPLPKPRPVNSPSTSLLLQP